MPELELPESAEALKALVLEQHSRLHEHTRMVAQLEQQLRESTALTEKLKFELARYRRWKFGKKSEALGADQIALWEAALDADIEAIESKL